MKNDKVYISVDTMTHFMVDVFTHLGVPQDDAHTCAEVLITSDLRGIESHGIGRLKMYYDRLRQRSILPTAHFEVVRETPATAVVNGHAGMGQVVGVRAMQMAIDKARAAGLGAVAVRNSTHFGIAGYYALMAVKQDMVGLAFCNARPTVAPTHGVQPILGTNPIAFGAPTDEEFPFLYDAATSTTQRGKIEVLGRLEQPTPVGWVIGDDGTYATDTQAILGGFVKEVNALLPLGGLGELMGGHKGYGLSVMVEILSSAFQDGIFLQSLAGPDKDGGSKFVVGHFFMALDIAHFTTPENFKATAGGIMRELRGSKKAPGQERIYTAGEKEYENEKKVRQQGVAVIPNLQKDIRTIQAELGLQDYHFPF